MKKVIVIYDDSRKPGQEISVITGHKSFGNTIFKRLSLKQRARARFMEYENVEAFMEAEEALELKDEYTSGDESVFKIYSDHEPMDNEAVRVLLEKSLYVKENYAVMSGDEVAAVLYPSFGAWLSSSASGDEKEYERINSDAFTDLTDPSAFRTFITSGFDARFFNALKGDEYTVVKTSANIDKLRMEYKYFTLLPDEMKQWYGTVFDYRETNNEASYSIERYHMTDLALRYVHGAIGEEEFKSIMKMLFHFIKIRKKKDVSDEEYEEAARSLYIDKVDERIETFKSLEGYDEIASYIKLGTAYEDIDKIVDRYKTLYNKITSGRRFLKVMVVGHGDLCFSNILYNHDARLLKLIDPKGAQDEEGLYMNPYYDIAKLSHSICGSYDYFNSDQYEISVGPNMKLRLKIDSDNDKYVKIFTEYLEENDIDIKLIRLYEASLFLSMLPLHIDRRKKVLGFILNAINILDEIERS
ncbi:MAG: hypothetical protein K5857_04795 [Lachnospiraceae bacterium]|nr:hypothetical protein [Lachnospiraceae bacterium]